MADLWDEVSRVKKNAKKSPNKSLLLTYVSAIDLRLTQLIEKSFIAGDQSLLIKSSSQTSIDFNQKIELAYRVGLMSGKMRETINALRKLRNDAAHDEDDIDFDNSNISSKVDHLYKGFSSDTRDAFQGKTTINKLEQLCSLIIVSLASSRDDQMPAKVMEDELPFTYKAPPPETKLKKSSKIA